MWCQRKSDENQGLGSHQREEMKQAATQSIPKIILANEGGMHTWGEAVSTVHSCFPDGKHNWGVFQLC